MTLKMTSEAPLEELASTAVRLGRELREAARDVCAGGNSGDFGFVSRTLRRLGERDPFDDRDDASLHSLRGILEQDLRSEVVGCESRFFATHGDMDGVYGEVRDCPVYSERGERLLGVLDTLERFLAARAATLDRMAAERAILAMMSR